MIEKKIRIFIITRLNKVTELRSMPPDVVLDP
jgi:hypothetical protein